MQTELRQKKLLFYALAYMTNINYLIVLTILSMYLEFDRDPYLSIIIWGIPAIISILFSISIIRNNLFKELPKEQGILKLSIAHIPSILGIMGALAYLFI